jgi:MFS family permease
MKMDGPNQDDAGSSYSGLPAAPSALRQGPLGEPQFRLLLVGQTTSAFGDAVAPVAIAFAALTLSGSASGIGLVFAAFTLSRLLLVLVGGVWADRVPRRLLMLAADAVRGIVEATIAILLIFDIGELWQLVVGAATMGAASAFFVPAATAVIPETVSAGRLQQGNALMGLSRSASGIVGPAIAGLLVASLGTGWVFAIDAGTFAVSGVTLLLLRAGSAAPQGRNRFVSDLADGWREVWSRRWLLAAIMTFGISNVALGTIFVLGPVVATVALGGAAAWGWIAAGVGVGGVIGGLMALRWTPQYPLATGFGLCATVALPLLALAVPLPVPVIAGSVAVTFTSVELANTWWYTVLQQRIPREALSRVSSYDWLASGTLTPLGFALVGPVSTLVGVPATLVGAAMLSLVSNLGVLSVRSLRLLTRSDPAPEQPPALRTTERMK